MGSKKHKKHAKVRDDESLGTPMEPHHSPSLSGVSANSGTGGSGKSLPTGGGGLKLVLKVSGGSSSTAASTVQGLAASPARSGVSTTSQLSLSPATSVFETLQPTVSISPAAYSATVPPPSTLYPSGYTSATSSATSGAGISLRLIANSEAGVECTVKKLENPSAVNHSTALLYQNRYDDSGNKVFVPLSSGRSSSLSQLPLAVSPGQVIERGTITATCEETAMQPSELITHSRHKKSEKKKKKKKKHHHCHHHCHHHSKDHRDLQHSSGSIGRHQNQSGDPNWVMSCEGDSASSTNPPHLRDKQAAAQGQCEKRKYARVTDNDDLYNDCTDVGGSNADVIKLPLKQQKRTLTESLDNQPALPTTPLRSPIGVASSSNSSPPFDTRTSPNLPSFEANVAAAPNKSPLLGVAVSGSQIALQQLLSTLLEQVRKRDTYEFFAWPVNDSIAPGYSSIIRHPMDLGTVRRRVDNGEYTTLDAFRADIRLITENATTYNRPETIYYKEARKLWRHAQKILSKENVIQQDPRLLNLLTVSDLGFDLREKTPELPAEQLTPRVTRNRMNNSFLSVVPSGNANSSPALPASGIVCGNSVSGGCSRVSGEVVSSRSIDVVSDQSHSQSQENRPSLLNSAMVPEVIQQAAISALPATIIAASSRQAFVRDDKVCYASFGSVSHINPTEIRSLMWFHFPCLAQMRALNLFAVD